MAWLNLYIDTDRGEPVIGPDDSSVAALPPLVQGDTLRLRVWLLSGFNQLASYSQIPVLGITLQVAIGTKTGNTGAIYTQQFTWTPSEDLGQPYFSGSIPMATAEITSLLGSGPSASAWLEVKMITDATPLTILSKPVKIQAAVIKPDAETVPAPLTPLSAEAANATFAGKVNVGHFQLMNSNGYGVDLWVDTDGTFHSDPITP